MPSIPQAVHIAQPCYHRTSFLTTLISYMPSIIGVDGSFLCDYLISSDDMVVLPDGYEVLELVIAELYIASCWSPTVGGTGG